MTDSDAKETLDKTANSAVPADDGGNSAVSASSSELYKNQKTHADEKTEPTDDGDGFTSELVKISIKAAAVALSVIMLILSILTVTLPFQAMGVFNKLGMSERALESGERYITGRIKANDAGAVDGIGNFTGVTATAEFNGEKFVEALNVCTALSDKLTAKAVGAGDTRGTRYYAEKLEKFTRIYASLSAFSVLNSEKDEHNISSVPRVDLRPYVYSYAHTVRVKNYRARAYLGETEQMLYNSGRSGDSVTTLDNRSNTMLALANAGVEISASNIDDFVDYAAQLGEYLTVEFEKLGLVGVALDETNVRDNYAGILDGTEFSIFITPSSGFTRVYEQLKCYPKFTQAAFDYDVTPRPGSAETESGNRLRQLYWLKELYVAATKLKYMSALLYYSSSAYGSYQNDIQNEYANDVCELYTFVDDRSGLGLRLISEVYDKLMAEYVAMF